MEVQKLNEARRNLDRMKNLVQDLQREADRTARETERHIRDLVKLTEDTNRFLADAESELRRVETK